MFSFSFSSFTKIDLGWLQIELFIHMEVISVSSSCYVSNGACRGVIWGVMDTDDFYLLLIYPPPLLCGLFKYSRTDPSLDIYFLMDILSYFDTIYHLYTFFIVFAKMALRKKMESKMSKKIQKLITQKLDRTVSAD